MQPEVEQALLDLCSAADVEVTCNLGICKLHDMLVRPEAGLLVCSGIALGLPCIV